LVLKASDKENNMAEIQVLKLTIPSARQLRAVRSWFGLSQTEFARKASIGRSTLVEYEKGHREIGAVSLQAIGHTLHDMEVEFVNGAVVLPE
jgi:predicted transcriptional regulator